MTTENVPLVVYREGRRKVLGRADVDLEKGTFSATLSDGTTAKIQGTFGAMSFGFVVNGDDAENLRLEYDGFSSGKYQGENHSAKEDQEDWVNLIGG